MIELALLAVALCPVVIWIAYFWEIGHFRAGAGMALRAICFGALTIFPVLVLAIALHGGIDGVDDKPSTIGGILYNAFIIAAFNEELFKWLALLILLRQVKPAIKDAYDIVVLSVGVSIGFVAVENVFYLMGEGDWTIMAILRAVTAVPSHAFTGAIMGCLALRAVVRNRKVDWLWALVIPIAMHGIYDIFAMGMFLMWVSEVLPVMLALLGGWVLFEAWLAIRYAKKAFSRGAVINDNPVQEPLSPMIGRLRCSARWRSVLWRLVALSYLLIVVALMAIGFGDDFGRDEYLELTLIRLLMANTQAGLIGLSIIAFCHGVAFWMMAGAVNKRPPEDQWAESPHGFHPTGARIQQ